MRVPGKTGLYEAGPRTGMDDTGAGRFMRKLVRLAARHGLRLELEFDDQEMDLDGESVTLNGTTILRGESDDAV